jgi:peptide/nickel transport system substrate-binding protein
MSLSRRDFLRLAAAAAGVTGGATLLTACQPTTPPAPAAKTDAPAAAPTQAAAAPTRAAAAPTAAPASSPKLGGTFVFGQRFEPDNLNPGTTITDEVHSVGAQVYSALLRQSFDMSLKPSIAEKWSVSPDGKTYTFNMVRGVKFHDGKPLTSADVKFSVEQVILPYHTQGKAIFGGVTGIETPDDHTVVFTLQNPFPPFPQYLTIDGAPILPKHLWDGTDILKNPLNEKPVGSGPFVFKEWSRGSHVTLERNPDYWIAGRPYLERVVIRFVPDPNARIQALEAGEVDAVFGYFPFSEFERLSKDARFKTVVAGSERLASISTNVCFNLRKDPFKKLEVRQAIAHALDKPLIVEKATFGVSRMAKAHIPMDLDWSNPNTRQYEFDVPKANQLLDTAGYPKGGDGMRFKANLKWNTSDAEHTKSAEVMVQLLKAVGIDVQLVPLESATWEDQVFINPDFDMTLRGIGTGPDPGVSALWRGYHSQNIKNVRLYNNMAYSNSKVDELFDKTAAEADQAKRSEYFKEIQAILMEELPSIPITERSDPKVWRAIWEGDVVAGPSTGLRNSWDNVWRK